MNRSLITLLVVLILAVQVAAHGKFIVDIDLSFDPELEEQVNQAAQDHLQLDEDPDSTELHRELLILRFDRELELSVAVSPLDYTIFGFRNDELLSKGESTLSEEVSRAKAEIIFNGLPGGVTQGLVYGEMETAYTGAQIHTWYRYVDGIYVLGEHLEVEIDPTDGDVIAWLLQLHEYPARQMTLSPAISHEVAQRIAEIRLEATPVGFDPILVIFKDKPVWIAKVKNLYPIFVGIDALEGDILFTGDSRGKLPDGYDYGRSVPVIPTGFINDVLGGS